MASQLPSEIWHVISSTLSRKNSLSLAKTSKHIFGCLLPKLYRIIDLAPESHTDDSDAANIATLELLTRTPNLSRTVRVLKITGRVVNLSNSDFRESHPSSRQAFLNALPTLHNLQSLQIPSSYLSRKDSQVRFFESLSHLHLDELHFYGLDQFLYHKEIRLPSGLKSFIVEDWDLGCTPWVDGYFDEGSNYKGETCFVYRA